MLKIDETAALKVSIFDVFWLFFGKMAKTRNLFIYQYA